MANNSPETQPNDDLMAPEASPGTASASGVRRVNKVPLMIGLMLLVLLAGGMGRWSLDDWLRRRFGSRA